MVVGKGCDFEWVAITVGVGPWLHVSGGYEVAGLGRTRGSSDAGEVYEVPLVGGRWWLRWGRGWGILWILFAGN